MLVQCVDRVKALFAAGTLDCVLRSFQYLDLRHLEGVSLVEWKPSPAYMQAVVSQSRIEGGEDGCRGCGQCCVWLRRKMVDKVPSRITQRDKEYCRRMHLPDLPSTVRDSSKWEEPTVFYAQHQQQCISSIIPDVPLDLLRTTINETYLTSADSRTTSWSRWSGSDLYTGSCQPVPRKIQRERERMLTSLIRTLYLPSSPYMLQNFHLSL
jgi:hypothetical protein